MLLRAPVLPPLERAALSLLSLSLLWAVPALYLHCLVLRGVPALPLPTTSRSTAQPPELTLFLTRSLSAGTRVGRRETG